MNAHVDRSQNVPVLTDLGKYTQRMNDSYDVVRTQFAAKMFIKNRMTISRKRRLQDRRL